MYVGKRHGLLRMKVRRRRARSKEQGARKRKDGLVLALAGLCWVDEQ